MDILQSTALTRLLSGDSDHAIFLRTAPPTKAKGLMLLIAIAHQKGLSVFYFSTRKHAQVINPIGKTTVSVLQHTDSYLGEKTKWFQLCDLLEYKPPKTVKCQPTPAPAPPSYTVATITGHDEDDVDNEEVTMSRTGITRDQIISEFEAGVRRFHRQEIEETFKGAESKQKAVKMLEKLHDKHDKRKNVPRIYDEIQASILKRHPMDVAPNWFADLIKSNKDYDRFQYFKSEGYRLHEEVQGFLDSCTWDEVMGYQDSDQEANNKDDQETDDEGSQAVKNKDISIRETNEKLRVGRCMAQLSNGVSVLTDMMASGRMARLCGTVVDDTIFDIQALVPGFDFGPEAKTAVHVSPIPPDLDKLEGARVYQFEHFSNILSGTSSQCTLSVSIN
ncbi:hypothetical protein BJV82DRAFT_618951 [Fennellomyces sp. T-0311]|nr:hypothetical protein BJV82DRAFT_618951 [Fennellomyces sp. T-0311]